MKWNDKGSSALGGGIFGIPPMFLLIGIVIIVVLLFTGFLAVIFAAKTLIVIALVGVGIYLLIKPSILATAGPIVKYLIPFALIGLGIAFYSGWLSF